MWFDDGFTTIPNTWARDSRISNQARGLLVQIASHKAGFKIRLAVLVAGSTNGRDAIRAQLSELQHAGYLTRTTFRESGSNLRRYRYRLHDPHAPHDATGQASFPVDSPVNDSGDKSADQRNFSKSGFPPTGNQSTGNPSTENPTRIRTLEKEQLDTDLEVTTEHATRPVDNAPAARCAQGHPLVRGETFCELGHYTAAEVEARREHTS